jgi:hypothetical protein
MIILAVSTTCVYSTTSTIERTAVQNPFLFLIEQNIPINVLFQYLRGRSENIRNFHASLFPRAAIYTHYILVKTIFVRQ